MAVKIIETLRCFYFITSRMGANAFSAYNFIYYACIDVVARDTHRAEQLATRLAPIKGIEFEHSQRPTILIVSSGISSGTLYGPMFRSLLSKYDGIFSNCMLRKIQWGRRFTSHHTLFDWNFSAWTPATLRICSFCHPIYGQHTICSTICC